MMIIMNLLGGLGNQMFQYAAGRALSTWIGQPLRLDVSGFSNYKLHNGFELSRLFAGPMELATLEEMKQLLGWRAAPKIRQQLLRQRFALLRGKRFVVEPHFHYWAGVDRLTSNVYLSGYWQSEKYFKNIEHRIRADFVFKQPMSGGNQNIADSISQCNAISLHVRRGDYIQNTNTPTMHAACSLDYYRLAIKKISREIKQPVFFVFSDDIDWVKTNLKIDFPCQYVDQNHGAESYNDMRLMSLCRHHIIANSSFSWWGAWLNQRMDKIVIYPKKWFNDPCNDISDLTPETWIPINI